MYLTLLCSELDTNHELDTHQSQLNNIAIQFKIILFKKFYQTEDSNHQLSVSKKLNLVTTFHLTVNLNIRNTFLRFILLSKIEDELQIFNNLNFGSFKEPSQSNLLRLSFRLEGSLKNYHNDPACYFSILSRKNYQNLRH